MKTMIRRVLSDTSLPLDQRYALLGPLHEVDPDALRCDTPAAELARRYGCPDLQGAAFERALDAAVDAAPYVRRVGDGFEFDSNAPSLRELDEALAIGWEDFSDDGGFSATAAVTVPGGETYFVTLAEHVGADGTFVWRGEIDPGDTITTDTSDDWRDVVEELGDHLTNQVLADASPAADA